MLRLIGRTFGTRLIGTLILVVLALVVMGIVKLVQLIAHLFG